MTLQDDGKVAFFFEEAPCFGDDQAKGYCMVYVPLTIEQITNGTYSTSEDETAIGSIKADKDGASSEIYDMSGRRINNPAKGVYIMSGKTVLVK